MKDIDGLLDSYEPGKPENKPDVLKQMNEMKERREKTIKEHNQRRDEELHLRANLTSTSKINEMTQVMNELLMENNQLKEKVKYLEDKITKLITLQIEERTKNKEQITNTK